MGRVGPVKTGFEKVKKAASLPRSKTRLIHPPPATDVCSVYSRGYNCTSSIHARLCAPNKFVHDFHARKNEKKETNEKKKHGMIPSKQKSIQKIKKKQVKRVRQQIKGKPKLDLMW